MSECLLELRGINKSFGGVNALTNINMKIYPGQVLCLAGENGCGKSTLIKIISGFYTPDGGTIIMDGREYEKMDLREAIKAGIQVVYQDFSIFPNLTVYENIGLNKLLVNRRKLVSRGIMKETAESALNQIGADIQLTAKVEELSVADKQLVAIARAIVNDARILILDEPTSALTNREVKELFKVIESLKEKGIAIVFVSHKLDEIFRICDRVSVLSNGKSVIEDDIGKFDKKKLVYYMTGKEYNDKSLASGMTGTEPIMTVHGLGLKNCFEDINFELYPGEVLGITGLLGSGRTELAQAIYGITPAERGEIQIKGKTVRIKNVQDGLRHKIAYIPEDRLTEGLFLPQSISRNMMISSLWKVSSRGGVMNWKLVENSVKEWVERLKVKTDNPENPVDTLSGGNQQKVVLAKGLATEPAIMILNCPTVGVDIGSKMDISRLMQQVAAQGIGVILISDDSNEILVNCRRFLMIKNGRIQGEYQSEDFTEESLYTELIC